jgi:hypothetical protein
MDTRGWTDEQLVFAVANAKSWRGVCRELGLKATSAGMLRSVKRHVERLGLDTTHFTHQRAWSDADLRQAVNGASTWSDVLVQLGLTDRGESRARVKGHALRLGLDTAHLQPPPNAPLPSEVHRLRPMLNKLRFAAESIAIAWFTFRGVPVAIPTEPRSYDFLATFAGVVNRIQVKSSTQRSCAGGYLVAVGHRPYSAEKEGGLVPYDPDELDFFFIVSGEGRLFLIPMSVVAGKVSIETSAYSQYRVGDAASLFEAAA